MPLLLFKYQPCLDGVFFFYLHLKLGWGGGRICPPFFMWEMKTIEKINVWESFFEYGFGSLTLLPIGCFFILISDGGGGVEYVHRFFMLEMKTIEKINVWESFFEYRFGSLTLLPMGCFFILISDGGD